MMLMVPPLTLSLFLMVLPRSLQAIQCYKNDGLGAPDQIVDCPQGCCKKIVQQNPAKTIKNCDVDSPPVGLSVCEVASKPNDCLPLGPGLANCWCVGNLCNRAAALPPAGRAFAVAALLLLMPRLFVQVI